MQFSFFLHIDRTLSGATAPGQSGPGSDLEIRERMETIQTTALLRFTRILRILETLEDLHSLRLQWKTIS